MRHDQLRGAARALFEYVVYAVAEFGDTSWYYVMEGDDEPYPVGRPASLFNVVEPSVAPSWQIDHRPDNPICQLLIAFPEWVAQPDYYDRLTDWDAREVAIFAEARKPIEADALRRLGRPLAAA